MIYDCVCSISPPLVWTYAAAAGADSRKLSKQQFVELLACDTLQAELAEPMLSRAVRTLQRPHTY